MNIVVTGKTGLLSQELKKLNNNIICLSSTDFDITQPDIQLKLEKISPNIIVHVGAITNSNNVKQNPTQAINVNIIGTANIANFCIKNNIRLVYISTDYVYEGTVGNYKETDPVLPVNEYAWTKLGGECSVKLVPNHLIIRTSFGPSKFPYNEAWTNQIVSKDYVDIIAPMILKTIQSNIVGTLNIGTEPKTLFDYAQKRNKVKPTKKPINKDFTLNTYKYEQSFSH